MSDKILSHLVNKRALFNIADARNKFGFTPSNNLIFVISHRVTYAFFQHVHIKLKRCSIAADVVEMFQSVTNTYSLGKIVLIFYLMLFRWPAKLHKNRCIKSVNSHICGTDNLFKNNIKKW